MIDSGRMISDEITVENAGAAFGKAFGIERHEGLHDSLQHRDIAADLHQVVGRGDGRRTQCQHFDGALRRCEPLQSALTQWIEDDNWHSALRDLAQRRQHARMISAGIVADAKERVAMIEILQGHGSLADTNRLRQPDARRLVTHIRAVRKIVGPVFPREQLIEKCRLIGCAAGRIKLRHVRMRQRAEHGANPRQRLLPRNRQVFVGCPVVGHRMSQPTFVLEVEIRPIPEFADRVPRKEIRRRPFGGRLPCDSLGTVLAEFERGGMFGIGPGAAGAIEAMRLIHAE